MKIATKLSMLFVSSLMLLAAFTPALALTSPIMAPGMILMSSGTAGSYNWSGYAVTGATGSVTSVSGSWTVPTVTSPTSGSNSGFGFTPSSTLVPATSLLPNSRPDPRPAPTTTYYAAFWLGIDGFSSSTVEQTGILAEAHGSTITWYAFYEFYPSAAILTSESISPGDTITASVTYSTSTGSFTTTISDTTHVWTVSATGTVPSAAKSSAEWIVETPTVNGRLASLANFGTVSFGGCSATISGVSGSIGSFGSSSTSTVYDITMYNYPRANTVMALPSSVSGGSFSVTWESAGP